MVDRREWAADRAAAARRLELLRRYMRSRQAAQARPPERRYRKGSQDVGAESYHYSELSVLEQVRADSVSAMKSGDKQRTGALRLLLSELQKDAKEGAGDELAVLRRERKRRAEAAKQFREGGRDELAAHEEFEAELIGNYLPADLDDTKLNELVTAAVTETGASSPKDMGTVMKLVMDRAGGLVDGKRASAAVRAALGA